MTLTLTGNPGAVTQHPDRAEGVVDLTLEPTDVHPESATVASLVLTFSHPSAYQTPTEMFAEVTVADLRALIAEASRYVEAADLAALAERWAAIDWGGLDWRDDSPRTDRSLERAALPDDLWTCTSCSEDSGWTERVWAYREAGVITVHPECGHCGWQPVLDQHGNALD